MIKLERGILSILIITIFACGCDYIHDSPREIKEREYELAELNWKQLKNMFPPPKGSKELTLKMSFPSEGDIKKGIYFKAPRHLDFNNYGDIYVTDSNQNVVIAFNSEGKFIKKFGREGQGPGEFIKPSFISIDSKNRIYICENGNMRIQIFSPVGVYQNSFRIYKAYSTMALGINNTIILSHLSRDAYEPLIEVLTSKGSLASSLGKRLPFDPYFFALNQIDISVNGREEIFVAWTNFPRVHRLSVHGELLSEYVIEYALLHELAKSNYDLERVKRDKTLLPVISAIFASDEGFYLLITFPRLEIMMFNLEGELLNLFWKETPFGFLASDFLIIEKEGQLVFYILQSYPDQLIEYYCIKE